jgi:hypothetical protein
MDGRTNGASRAALIQDLNGKHADATMLVNAAGVFVPKSFLEPGLNPYSETNSLGTLAPYLGAAQMFGKPKQG